MVCSSLRLAAAVLTPMAANDPSAFTHRTRDRLRRGGRLRWWAVHGRAELRSTQTGQLPLTGLHIGNTLREICESHMNLHARTHWLTVTTCSNHIVCVARVPVRSVCVDLWVYVGQPCPNSRDSSCPKGYQHWEDNAYLKLHGSHYWMDPCSNWGYSNYSAAAIGCDRTSVGSGYAAQYPAGATESASSMAAPRTHA